MAKPRRNRPAFTDQLTRRTTPNQSLGHTVSRSPDFDGFEAEIGLTPQHSAFPLIRTVLVDSPPPPRRGKRQSPLVPVRATGRSSQDTARRFTRFPTTELPQLTERAIVCARRHIRKEVLFAKRKTGKGSKSPRRYRSKVRC